MTTAPSCAAPDRCSSRANAAASAGSRRATSAIVLTPLVSVTPIAFVATPSCSMPARACPARPPARPARPRGSRPTSQPSPRLLRGLLTLRGVGRAGIVDPGHHRLGRQHRALEALADATVAGALRLRLRLLGRAADRAGQAHIRHGGLDLAPPHADRAADALRPLTRRNGLAALVAVADERRHDENDNDPDDDRTDPTHVRASPKPRPSSTRRRCRRAVVQNRCTVGMLTRLVGRVRPLDLRSDRQHVQMPADLRADDGGLEARMDGARRPEARPNCSS